MSSKSMSGLSSIIEEWETLNKDFAKLEGLQKSYSKAVDELKSYEDLCKKGVDQQMKGLFRISEAIKCYTASSDTEKEDVLKLRLKSATRKQELIEMQSTLPKKTGLYLKIVLGGVDVTLLNAQMKYKYKDEYEKFKLVVTIISFVLSAFNIFVSYRASDAILHFLLVWYYCTLTIRESILKANGSRIKGWWRTHHFITTILAGVLILWPDGKTYQTFRLQFMLYSCYTSFLQFLQYNYQQGCLYRLRALGERYNMDITVDGFHSWMWKGLTFLLPFLTFGYCWQLYNAYVLLHLCTTFDGCEWQVGASGMIFLILFAGNSITTTLSVQQKFSLKALLLRKSK